MKQIIFVDDNETEVSEVKRLVSAVPITILCKISEEEDDEQYILQILCKDEDGNSLMLNAYFITENLDDEEFIITNDLYRDNIYPPIVMGTQSIASGLTNYATDFSFDFDGDKITNDIHEFYFNAINIKESTYSKFIVDRNLYSSIRYYIEHMMIRGTNNNKFIIASSYSIQTTDEAEIIMVNSINSIVNLAKYKKSTTIAIVFECTATNGDGEENNYTILTSFDLGKHIKNKKCKGNTIEQIENKFLKEIDQYVESFTFMSAIHKLGKEYMVIKAFNKDETTKLFFINNNCIEKLAELINER